MDNTDVGLVDRLGVLEAESQHALGGATGDELDGLDDTIDNLVLNSGVLALGVLADQDGVDVVVGSLEAGNGHAGTDVGEQVEGAAERQVVPRPEDIREDRELIGDKAFQMAKIEKPSAVQRLREIAELSDAIK